ncbi:MAG: hypothetical protein KKG04_08830 [Candidatus Thermoplasmatota archaeon]|nr:hypothetical protein [Candidatus Thermoplasmatota archaeon]
MDLKAKLTKIIPKRKPKPTTKTIEQTPPLQTERPPTEQPIHTVEKPIKIYHETLYSKGHTPKEPPQPKQIKTNETSWKPKQWEGITNIEKNIDTIHTTDKPQHTTASCTETNIDRKVDLILKKKYK